MHLSVLHHQILRKNHLFHSLSDEEMQILLQNAHQISLKKGKFLFHQGQTANRFYFVISGCMRLFRTLIDGTEKTIELIHQENTFAEALLFSRQHEYPVTSQAIQDTVLLDFSNNDYLNLLKANPDLSLRLLDDLSHRLRSLINEIEMLSIKNSTHRVTRYLLNQLTQTGDKENTLRLPAPKNLIANQLGIQPETFSRILNRLKIEGIIDIQGKRVTILDMELLTDYELIR